MDSRLKKEEVSSILRFSISISSEIKTLTLMFRPLALIRTIKSLYVPTIEFTFSRVMTKLNNLTKLLHSGNKIMSSSRVWPLIHKMKIKFWLVVLMFEEYLQFTKSMTGPVIPFKSISLEVRLWL